MICLYFHWDFYAASPFSELTTLSFIHPFLLHSFSFIGVQSVTSLSNAFTTFGFMKSSINLTSHLSALTVVLHSVARIGWRGMRLFMRRWLDSNAPSRVTLVARKSSGVQVGPVHQEFQFNTWVSFLYLFCDIQLYIPQINSRPTSWPIALPNHSVASLVIRPLPREWLWGHIQSLCMPNRMWPLQIPLCLLMILLRKMTRFSAVLLAIRWV